VTTPLEHLRTARALLEDPAHWTQGSFARDKDGAPAPMNDPDVAVAWCAMGALYATHSEPGGRLMAFRFLTEAGPMATVPRSDLTRYNDNLPDHGALLAWFDRAIALAEQAHDIAA
jgi:hypothetical protein